MKIRLAAAAMGLSLSAAHAQAAEIGMPAPACALAALADAPATELRADGASVLYVDFWASWCVPCLQSFPFMNALQRDYAKRGLKVIGVNVDEQSADAVRFLRLHPAAFTVGADAQGSCPRAFGVMGMPSSFLVDRRGVIRYVQRGFRPGAERQLRQQVAGLLAEELAATAAARQNP